MANNPLVNEGLISKIKRKSGKDGSTSIAGGVVEAHLIGMNDAMNVCAQACACCWDRTIPEGYQEIAEYVAKRSRIGHTSVLEHSNVVLYLYIDAVFNTELLEFMSWVHYLNTRLVKSLDGTHYHMIIGGSYRGFSDIYRETDDLNNPILKAITGVLYTYGHSAAFEDICKLGLLDKNSFMNVEPDENFNLLNALDSTYENELFDVIGMDSLKKLFTNLYKISKEAASMISTFDLIKFTTVSIMFKNMSRTCTHQLVRHRNAITQESQRYVDYSQACFNSPEMFKPEKYDKDHKYTIRFGPSSPMSLTLSEIGTAMCNIYSMLQNPASAGASYALLKEDARAFLPSNVQCKKIYITFTLKNFLKFLNLREDKAAQAEIRKYATAVGEWFRANTEFTTKELCDLYTTPRLLIEDPFKIDVDEGVVDENFELTEEDYVKAYKENFEDDENDSEGLSDTNV